MNDNTKQQQQSQPTTYYVFLDEHNQPQMVAGTPVLTTTNHKLAQSTLYDLWRPTVYLLSYELRDFDGCYDYGTSVFVERDAANNEMQEWFKKDLRAYFQTVDIPAADIAALIDGREHYLRNDRTETTYSDADILVCYTPNACYRIHDMYNDASTRVWIREEKAQ